jgi:glycosyltransferase involved in cell wall biosynthesis
MLKESGIKLSVIVPVYNGALTISRLVLEVVSELKNIPFEIILVNDGSIDDSEFICENLAYDNPEVQFISLRKNFGEHNAVLCGLNASVGDFAVIIDDDFQNPPSEIKKLYTSIISGGYDVVYSKYSSKKHNLYRRIGSKFHNWVANYILDKPSDLYLSSFKIIKKEIIEEITNYKGPYPYIDGFILQTTSNIGTCLVEHHKRETGKSNYTLKKLVSLYLNMFINHSIKPMRVLMLVGLSAFFIGTLLRVLIFINFLLNNVDYSDTVHRTILYATLSGIQLLFIGIVGEYITKSLTSMGGYPQFSVKSRIVNQKKRKGEVLSKEYKS